MPLLPHADYFYDITRASAYLLLNGSPELVHSVIRFLEENQLICTGTGKSKYPAHSGAQYDWFVRIETTDGKKPEPAVIHPLLRRFVSDEDARFRTDVKVLQSQTAELQERLARLKQSQAEAEARLSEREEELARLRARNKNLAEKQASIKTTVAEWKAAAAEWGAEAERLQEEIVLLEQERSSLESQLKEAKEFTAEFQDEFDAQAKRLNILEQQYISVCEERDHAKHRLSEVSQSHNSEEERRSTSPIAFIEETLSTLLPNVEFLKDSIDIIAVHLANPRPAIERIRQIVFEKARGKKVQAADGWQRFHFNTGLDDSGRIYFRRTNENGYKMLISFKPNQSQDIDYLKQQ